jgi:hypothetical protein
MTGFEQEEHIAMNVGELRHALAGLSDDVEVLIEDEECCQHRLLQAVPCTQISIDSIKSDPPFYVTDAYASAMTDEGTPTQFITIDRTAFLLSFLPPFP